MDFILSMFLLNKAEKLRESYSTKKKHKLKVQATFSDLNTMNTELTYVQW
jgi:hypothetical protein